MVQTSNQVISRAFIVLIMDYESMLARRQACAGGPPTSHRMANCALKGLRFIGTRENDDDCSESGLFVNLTDQDMVQVVPWAYTTDKGPSGQWEGQTVDWSWKDYIACIDPDTYRTLFGENGITSFICRACPFPSPYPPTAGTPHWEFTATRSDEVQVGLHPPGRGGKLSWTFEDDETRAAALAVVKRKGVSTKVRACFQTHPLPDQTHKRPRILSTSSLFCEVARTV